MSKVVDFTGVVQVEKGAPFEFQAKLGGYMYKFAGKVLLSGDQARIEKAMEPTRPVLRRRGGGGYDTENPKYVKANDKWQTDVVLAQFLLAVDSLDMAGDIQHQIDASRQWAISKTCNSSLPHLCEFKACVWRKR